MVDAHGQPLVQYHGTPRTFSKDQFQSGVSGQGSIESIGFHFGNDEAANARIMPKLENQGPSEAQLYSWHIMPVYLSIKNPLRVPDLGDWHSPRRVAQWLVQEGGIDQAQMDEAVKKSGHQGKMRAIIKVLQANGYDGLVYKNLHEGGGDSWIAFDPRQIKSAIGNDGKFDPKSPKMTASARSPLLQKPASQETHA